MDKNLERDVLAVAMGIINGQISDEQLMAVANLEQAPMVDENGNIRMMPEPVTMPKPTTAEKMNKAHYPKL